MDIHQQWLASEREKKQQSDNFSRSVFAAKLFLIPLAAPWIFLDGTDFLARVGLSIYYALAFVGTIAFRRGLSVGSLGRYVANWVAVYSGMFLLISSAVLAISALRND